MTFEQLKEKALSLPYAPGVYIMRDKSDTVIYVGKAKKLKNRVTQYFQDTGSHTPKTKMMVQKIHHFDVIVAASEFEALVLECSLIKQHLPKYNILLKDDKGYPYVRLDMRDAYPRLKLVNKITNDGAEYYGPYGSRGTTTALIQTLLRSLKLPDCSKDFPKDIGKGRPCLNYHMNQCLGWCKEGQSHESYRSAMEHIRQLLRGNYKSVAETIRSQMLSAAETLDFELAAQYRDRLNAVEALSQKQLVTAGSLSDTDVIGYGETATKACFAVLHFSNGNLLDKDYEIFSRPDDKENAVSSLLKQYYLSRGLAPGRILLPFEIEESALISQLFQQNFQRNVRFAVPQRGDKQHLVELANKNAQEEAARITGKEEKLNGSVALLGKMLGIDTPSRIESYDISNISGTDIVAGMVVFQDGKPRKSDYRKFKLDQMEQQDDYGSMRCVLERRFAHFIAGDKGFSEKPDLLLIDGGINHANVALQVLQMLQLSIPVFGMVKDDRHRTRALVTPQGQEIAIDSAPSVFAFLGSIQEEVHRYAISYHRNLRSKRLRYSQLDEIPGIGPSRKQELLKTFKSITGIAQASLAELERILPKNAALEVYQHFQRK